MHIRVTRNSQGYRYLQIAESYRDPESRRPKSRHIASLGRLDKLEDADIDGLVNGLLRAAGRPTLDALDEGISEEHTTFEPARDLGDIWAITHIWHQLKLAQTIARTLRARRHRFDVEGVIRTLVINRLSDPQSKLGVLRWLETAELPGVERDEVTYAHLLRAMDLLIEHKDALERSLTGELLPLFDDELEVAFYDLTTVPIHGDSEQDGELRRAGRSKDTDGIHRQYVVGLVQTAEGLPITHEVFEGNVAEVATVRGIVERLCERFPLKRLILVADRGLLSEANLSMLEDIRLPDGRAVEYIVAVAARRFKRYAEPLARLHPYLVKTARETGAEAITEAPVCEDDGVERRLVVAHDPEAAAASRADRRRRLEAAREEAFYLEHRLDGQDRGETYRGRPLSDGGAKMRFHEHLQETGLYRFIRVVPAAETFCFEVDGEAFRREWRLDGKLLLITNVQDQDATEIVRRYKSLADIERGFRTLKSDLALAPVHHRLPERIRAHTLICFMALTIQRIMRRRLKAAGSDASPMRALERLRTIQRHAVRLPTGKWLHGLSTITTEQRELFDALEVPTPTQKKVNDAA